MADSTAREPQLAGMRLRPAWALTLFGLLATSGAVSMWAAQSPTAEPWLKRVAPWMFLAFVCGFAVYRVALVLSKRYSAFKAFAQIFIGILFFLILVWPQMNSASVNDEGLLHHPEARVRSLAAEMAGLKHERSQSKALISLLSDEDQRVRQQAHQALVSLNEGEDLGLEAAPWAERLK